jgi:hypothetical protein
MPTNGFVVVYDVLEENLLVSSIGPALFVLCGAAFGSALLIRARRVKSPFQIGFAIVWLVLWAGLGGVGLGNVFYQRWRCISWARAEDFAVVEGRVHDFVPMPYAGHADESFGVGDTRFSYSDFNISKGGFNNTASHGGPIREGLYVRVSHRNGRILKLEVPRGQ